jgi:hypothetical protein
MIVSRPATAVTPLPAATAAMLVINARLFAILLCRFQANGGGNDDC